MKCVYRFTFWLYFFNASLQTDYVCVSHVCFDILILTFKNKREVHSKNENVFSCKLVGVSNEFWLLILTIPILVLNWQYFYLCGKIYQCGIFMINRSSLCWMCGVIPFGCHFLPTYNIQMLLSIRYVVYGQRTPAVEWFRFKIFEYISWIWY